jgi:hypothetical protein
MLSANWFEYSFDPALDFDLTHTGIQNQVHGCREQLPFMNRVGISRPSIKM